MFQIKGEIVGCEEKELVTKEGRKFTMRNIAVRLPGQLQNIVLSLSAEEYAALTDRMGEEVEFTVEPSSKTTIYYNGQVKA